MFWIGATKFLKASKIVALMTGKDDFGTVARGKRAELILLGDNPRSNIDHIKNIKGVMAAGRWYDEQAISDWKKPWRGNVTGH